MNQDVEIHSSLMLSSIMENWMKRIAWTTTAATCIRYVMEIEWSCQKCIKTTWKLRCSISIDLPTELCSNNFLRVEKHGITTVIIVDNPNEKYAWMEIHMYWVLNAMTVCFRFV